MKTMDFLGIQRGSYSNVASNETWKRCMEKNAERKGGNR